MSTKPSTADRALTANQSNAPSSGETNFAIRPGEIFSVLFPVIAFGLSLATAIGLEIVYGDGDYVKLGSVCTILGVLAGVSVRRRIQDIFERIESQPLDSDKSVKQALATPNVRPGRFSVSTPSATKKADSASVGKMITNNQASISSNSKAMTTPSRTGPLSAITPVTVTSTTTSRRFDDDSLFSSPQSMLLQSARTPQQKTPAQNQQSQQQPSSSLMMSSMVAMSARTATTPLSALAPSSAIAAAPASNVSSAPIKTLSALMGVDEDAARTVLDSMKSPHDRRPGNELMEEWVLNLKQVLREYMADTVLRQLDELNKKLTAFNEPLGLFPMSVLEWSASSSSSRIGSSVSATNGSASKKALKTEEDLTTRSQFFPPGVQDLLRRRKELEQFFSVRRSENMMPFPKAYVLQRMRSLVKGDALSEFRWDGGENFLGRDWNAKELCTDSEIVFNVFCWAMDSMVKKDEREPSFYQSYVRDCDSVISAEQLEAEDWIGFLNCGRVVTSSELALATSRALNFAPAFMEGSGMLGGNLLQRTYQPHYKVVFSGKVLEVRPRRLNVFHAIIIFLYKIKLQGVAKLDDLLNKIFSPNRYAD